MSLALLFPENTWPWPPYCKQIADTFWVSEIFIFIYFGRLEATQNCLKNKSIVCELCIMIAYTIPIWKAFSSRYYSVKWVDSWKQFFIFRMITAAKTRKYSAWILTSRTWDIHKLGIFYDTSYFGNEFLICVNWCFLRFPFCVNLLPHFSQA